MTSTTETATGAPTQTGRVLDVRDLQVHYGEARAVAGVSFALHEGSCVAVLGPNGAGKTSVAKAITGVVRPSAGSVTVAGRDITGWPAYRVARLGVAHVPEGRGILPGLSVIDNLRMGLRHSADRAGRKDAMNRVFELFPVLGVRRRQIAGTLSGGEQQMLSLARVLAVPPKLLVVDELSRGLAPIIVQSIFDNLRVARQEGVTIVLIEQFVEAALAFSDEVIIMRRGEIGWTGPASEAGEQVLAQYLD